MPGGNKKLYMAAVQGLLPSNASTVAWEQGAPAASSERAPGGAAATGSRRASGPAKKQNERFLCERHTQLRLTRTTDSSQSSCERGHDNRQTDGETTQPQRFGALTCHQIRFTSRESSLARAAHPQFTYMYNSQPRAIYYCPRDTCGVCGTGWETGSQGHGVSRDMGYLAAVIQR